MTSSEIPISNLFTDNNLKAATIRRNFIARNDAFICEACDEKILPAQGTFRNHCPHCLTSKHVDGPVPGDRASNCNGLMPTVFYEGTSPSKLDLVQECKNCGHRRVNKVARDDNWQILLPNT